MGLLDRFQMIPGQHRPRTTRNGVIFLALFGGLLYFAYSGGLIPLWPKGGEVVRAEFVTAANVQPGKTPVRMKGVDVGEVEAVERRSGGRGVVVTMRLNKGQDIDLREDARADILWRTLLGFGFYIQLDEGGAAGELGDTTIPVQRTTAQVELDQVLAAADKPSRAGMQTLFEEFDKGFGGGRSGRALDAIAPTMRQAAPGLAALRGVRAGDLTQTVKDVSRLMGALAKSEQQLGEVIGHADTTLAVTAARRADLQSILSNGPSTLDQTTSTMRRVRSTLDALDPVAQDLRPGVRRIDDASKALRPALAQLQPVLDHARPLLRDLRPALTRLRSASKTGVPLMRELEPTLDRLDDTIVPKLNERGETELKLYETVGPTVAGVDSAAQQFDQNGHTMRFNAVAGGERTLSALPCNSDLFKGDIDCSDVQGAVGRLLGIVGGGETTSKPLLASSPRSSLKRSSDEASRSRDAGGPAATAADRATDLVVQVTKTLGEML